MSESESNNSGLVMRGAVTVPFSRVTGVGVSSNPSDRPSRSESLPDGSVMGSRRVTSRSSGMSGSTTVTSRRGSSPVLNRISPNGSRLTRDGASSLSWRPSLSVSTEEQRDRPSRDPRSVLKVQPTSNSNRSSSVSPSVSKESGTPSWGLTSALLSTQLLSASTMAGRLSSSLSCTKASTTLAPGSRIRLSSVRLRSMPVGVMTSHSLASPARSAVRRAAPGTSPGAARAPTWPSPYPAQVFNRNLLNYSENREG